MAIVGEAGIGKSRLVQEFLSDRGAAADVAQRLHDGRRSSVPGQRISPDRGTIAIVFRDFRRLPKARRCARASNRTVRALDRAACTSAIVPLLSLARRDSARSGLGSAGAEPPPSPAHRGRDWTASSSSAATAASWSSSRTCTGSMPQAAWWSKAWSRRSKLHASSCWSTTVPSSPTAGPAAASTVKSGSIHCPIGACRLCSTTCWGSTHRSGSLKSRLSERAGGNPFFLEECVSDSRGVGSSARGSPECTRFVGEADMLALPETVHAVIAARLDRLNDANKQLAPGRSRHRYRIFPSTAHDVGGLTDDDFDGAIADLQAVEFLAPARIIPETVYRFKHALTHEVVYGSLLKQRRLELHRHILDAIERDQAHRIAEQIETLAFHAARAEDWAEDRALCPAGRDESGGALGQSGGGQAVRSGAHGAAAPAGHARSARRRDRSAHREPQCLVRGRRAREYHASPAAGGRNRGLDRRPVAAKSGQSAPVRLVLAKRRASTRARDRGADDGHRAEAGRRRAARACLLPARHEPACAGQVCRGGRRFSPKPGHVRARGRDEFLRIGRLSQCLLLLLSGVVARRARRGRRCARDRRARLGALAAVQEQLLAGGHELRLRSCAGACGSPRRGPAACLPKDSSSIE